MNNYLYLGKEEYFHIKRSTIVVDKRLVITQDTHSKTEWMSWTRLYDLANNNNNDIDLENKNINNIDLEMTSKLPLNDLTSQMKIKIQNVHPFFLSDDTHNFELVRPIRKVLFYHVTSIDQSHWKMF